MKSIRGLQSLFYISCANKLTAFEKRTEQLLKVPRMISKQTLTSLLSNENTTKTNKNLIGRLLIFDLMVRLHIYNFDYSSGKFSFERKNLSVCDGVQEEVDIF